MPRPTIAHLEAGQANPTLSVALRVARALGVRLEELVHGPEAPIVVLSLRNLPTERLPRLRRVQLVPLGVSLEAKLERLVLKAGGRMGVDPAGGQVLLIAERGEFVLNAGGVDVPLPAESAAFLRAKTELSAISPGVLYRMG